MNGDPAPAGNVDRAGPPDRLGDLEQADGRWRLIFTRRLSHRPEVVWRALTEPDHLRAWFPQEVVVDHWEVGAPLRFVGRGQHEVGFSGEVVNVEPPSVLEFTWGTDVLRFEITPAGSGCLLMLADTIDEVGKAARDSAGWHVCLDSLQAHLDGTTVSSGTVERWMEVHPSYVDKLGPEASTIGPPEGWREKAGSGPG